MIKLERIRTEEAIVGSLRGRWRKDKNKKLILMKRELVDIPSKNFKSPWWKKSKPQIKLESNNKCAYCEADTASVAHGDVEHFRPKSKYWWLAYCYENYLYSCQLCNQSYKSNNFPISGERLSEPAVMGDLTEDEIKELADKLTSDPFDIEKDLSLSEFQKSCRKEKPDLIDPYVEDPEKFLEYLVNPSPIKEIRVKVKGNSAHRKAMDEALNDYYGLNREELTKLRWKTYRIIETLKNTLSDLAISTQTRKESQDLLNELTESSQRFAGMVRFFVKKWNLDLE